jgi:hypothetical protein
MNSDLQNKLQQFSADPPAGVWNKIAEALDTEEGFAQRLYQYEETPPAANWQKIEQHLAAHAETGKVVPFGKRITKPVRYIAVASLLVVILVTATLTIKRTEAGALDTEGTAVAPATNLPVTAGTLPINTDQQPGTFSQPAQSNSQEFPGPQTRETSSRSGKPAISTTPINAALNDYVTYSDGNGKVVKVSRKMETYINCSDSDQQCKQRLQQLRQKMAARAMTTDFTGILEMLQQLQ